MSPTPRHSLRHGLYALLLLTIIGSITWAGEPSVPAPASRRTAIVGVVERTKAAVVNIHSERQNAVLYGDRNLSGTSGRSNGMGTGIIMDARGYIVTNYHVVDDVIKLQVRLSGDETRAVAPEIFDPGTRGSPLFKA